MIYNGKSITLQNGIKMSLLSWDEERKRMSNTKITFDSTNSLKT